MPTRIAGARGSCLIGCNESYYLDLLRAADPSRLPARPGLPRQPAQAEALAQQHDRVAPGDPAPALHRRAALRDFRRPEDEPDGPERIADLRTAAASEGRGQRGAVPNGSWRRTACRRPGRGTGSSWSRAASDAYRQIMRDDRGGPIDDPHHHLHPRMGRGEPGDAGAPGRTGPGGSLGAVCSSTTWVPGGFPGANWRR